MLFRSFKSVGVVLGVVGIMAVTQVPASAAQSFNIQTDSSDGYAHTYGSVSYIDANSVSVTSYVADICASNGAGDGEGAYVWFQIKYTDGSYDGGTTININFDNDGCSNGYEPRSITFHPGRNINWVRVRLDEANGPSDSTPDTVVSTQKDNPYT